MTNIKNQLLVRIIYELTIVSSLEFILIEVTGVFNRVLFSRGLKFYDYVSRFLELHGRLKNFIGEFYTYHRSRHFSLPVTAKIL